MSANLIVDLGNTAQLGYTLPNNVAIGSGGIVDSRLSGISIGQSVDMLNSDTYCNLLVAGICNTSGPLVLQVQTSDSDTSGNYTDPTSGLASFPSSFTSGGLITLGGSGIVNPGLFNSGFVSGQALLSGFAAAAAFIRNGRFARANVLSGFYQGPLTALFVSNLKTTGSGGGYSPLPSSGTVNV
jgi:hypothetical protein